LAERVVLKPIAEGACGKPTVAIVRDHGVSLAAAERISQPERGMWSCWRSLVDHRCYAVIVPRRGEA